MVQAQKCESYQIFIRSQNVYRYKKKDGTLVKRHFRKAHCRSLSATLYFKDGTQNSYKNLKPHLKAWSSNEKAIFEKHLALTPKWLKKYALQEVLRASFDDNHKSPAATVPAARTMILYDGFFKATNKTSILTHELAHFAFHSLSDPEVEDFYTASGWTVIERPIKVVTAPKELIIEDSIKSVSEDFSNYIEVFYVDPKKLNSFNPKIIPILNEIIKRRDQK